MKLSLLLLFVAMLIISNNASATHIVGGEFELKYVRGNLYRLQLKMYFDEVNGDSQILTNPGDQSLTAYIFSKATNQRVSTVLLPKVSTSRVNYTDPLCSNSSLKTLILIYESELILSPDFYNNPAGYYIVWERCCRNGVISNILDPGGTGQVFYLEFPAVTYSGSPVVNSSPALFSPLSDYACVNRPFYYDFSGKDPDGDSLVYSLVNPLAGISSRAEPLPEPTSGPYSEVLWLNGYNTENMIRGNPSLKIDSKSGQLFLIPNRTGLFVFSVRCEEFRGGRKLGEVRRDFQMMVLDCPVNNPPKISVTPPANKVFEGKKDTVTFNIGEERCFKFSVKDQEANTKLNVKLKPVNFAKLFTEQVEYTKQLSSDKDELAFDLCFPDCPLPNNEPYIIEVIAKDNGCSLPLLDTAILVVNVLPLPNKLATMKFEPSNDAVTVVVGNSVSLDISGNDEDGDSLFISPIPSDFIMEKAGMTFEGASGAGFVSTQFNWSPDCNFLDLNVKDEYEIDFLLKEKDKCGIIHETIKTYKIRVEDDPNQPPLISINKSFENTIVPVYIGQKIEFDIYGEDPDQYYINLTGRGKGFRFEDVGISFQNMDGNYSVTSPFSWLITCDQLRDSVYELEFIVYDKSCFNKAYDTINVSIQVKDFEEFNGEFYPPNVFTPNGDGKNDYFKLEDIISDGEVANTSSLPKDICGNKFEEIIIVNRWGKIIFKDKKRDFSWDAKGYPVGAYFYTLKYSKSIYKGTISILF